MKIEIKNLKVNNYEVTLTINPNEKIGVFSKDKNTIITFFDLLSGCQYNNNAIMFDNNNIYDNKEYFTNRIYLNFEKKYLSTLKLNSITEQLKRYNLDFNKDEFIKICKDLNVKGETDITYKYEFTKTGNTFVNFAFLCSVNKKNIIINNPTYNLSLVNDLKYISSKLTSEEFNNVILGLDNISAFKNRLDKIVLFSDYNEILVLDNNSKLIVFDADIEKYFLIKNKIYKDKKIIAQNKYTKEELKYFQSQKIKFEQISIYDVRNYIGEV